MANVEVKYIQKSSARYSRCFGLEIQACAYQDLFIGMVHFAKKTG
jgi:hypothetical protein